MILQRLVDVEVFLLKRFIRERRPRLKSILWWARWPLMKFTTYVATR